jgi:hypothetical protein
MPKRQLHFHVFLPNISVFVARTSVFETSAIAARGYYKGDEKSFEEEPT